MGAKLWTCLKIAVFALLVGSAAPHLAAAQESTGPSAGVEQTPATDREATGGMQTLDDILRRQRGEQVAPDAGTGSGPDRALTDQLGTQGSVSDSEFWRQVRQGDTFTVSIPDKKAATLVQDTGEDWLAFRNGPLSEYTLWAIAITVAVLALFLLLRGRIGVEGGMSGIRIQRFGFLERFGHWLLATSFLVLAVTGIALLVGREYLIPAIDHMHQSIHGANADPAYGKKMFAGFAGAGKWLHNNLSWAFMAALVLIFFMWVLRNIPTWTDVKWFAKGGGIFSDSSHPHARKFNGGQKIIFWSVVVLGASISASGLSLLFPYEFPMFSATFAKLNDLGAMIGDSPNLRTNLTAIEEMQYAQMWHVIVSAVLIVIIIAHIYIGSIGMKGAFSAMGSGKVDLTWARQHHDLWVEELERKGEIPRHRGPGIAPVQPTQPVRRVEPKAPSIPAE